MSHGQCHGGESLGRGVDDHHRVLVPRLTGLLVPHAAPEIDDLFAAHICADRATQFTAAAKVLDECLAHGLETAGDLTADVVFCRHCWPPLVQREPWPLPRGSPDRGE